MADTKYFLVSATSQIAFVYGNFGEVGGRMTDISVFFLLLSKYLYACFDLVFAS